MWRFKNTFSREASEYQVIHDTIRTDDQQNAFLFAVWFFIFIFYAKLDLEIVENMADIILSLVDSSINKFRVLQAFEGPSLVSVTF